MERNVLPPRNKLGWSPAKGKQSPPDSSSEIVVFAPFFEAGFGLPAGPFFRGMLNYYGIELHHLNPNSILQISIFIHLCEAFLGVDPHFSLFQHLFLLKSHPNDNCPNVVGGAGFQLRHGMAPKYLEMPLNETNKGWHEQWFTCENIAPRLPPMSGKPPQWNPSWTKSPPAGDMDQVVELMQLISDLKKGGLTGVAVAICFTRRLIQPIKHRTSTAYEYNGIEDPCRESERGVSSAECVARVKKLFTGPIGNKNLPRPFHLYRPPPEVRNQGPSMYIGSGTGSFVFL